MNDLNVALLTSPDYQFLPGGQGEEENKKDKKDVDEEAATSQPSSHPDDA